MDNEQISVMKSNAAYRKEIYYLGKMLWQNIEQEWNAWLEGEGLSINEYIILSSLADGGEWSVSQLSKTGMMHISTALNFSKKLEQKGYLDLKKHREDRRVTYGVLTVIGKKKIEKIEAKWTTEDSDLVQRGIAIESIIGVKPSLNEINLLCNERCFEK